MVIQVKGNRRFKLSPGHVAQSDNNLDLQSMNLDEAKSFYRTQYNKTSYG